MSTETAPAPPAAAAQPSAKFKALHEKVQGQMKELSALAAGSEADLNLKNEAVSQWTVAQHIDHTASVVKGILALIMMISNSKNPSTDGAPKLLAKIILFVGYLPRGKGKAPDQFVPKAASHDEIRKNVQMMDTFIKGLEPRLAQIEASKGRAPHPVLGSFTPAEWLRFIDIHTNHHFKIIRDIKKKA